MPYPSLDTIPKEMYLLIGAVLGFFGAMMTTLINRGTQLKLAREAHRQQYEMEALKAQAQAEHEAQLYLRTKIEEAHQMLSKIALENSLDASGIMLDSGMTVAECDAQYQRQQLELQRLQMLVALYFPKLEGEMNNLMGPMYHFWRLQKYLLAKPDGFKWIHDHRPLLEILQEEISPKVPESEEAPHTTWGSRSERAWAELMERTGEITGHVRTAQSMLTEWYAKP